MSTNGTNKIIPQSFRLAVQHWLMAVRDICVHISTMSASPLLTWLKSTMSTGEEEGISLSSLLSLYCQRFTRVCQVV